MRDRGVGKHALDIHLDDTGEGAHQHGQDDDNNHNRDEAPLQGCCHNLEEAKHRTKGCELNRGGHEAGNGSRRACVDIRSPRVEGSSTDLEKQADHDHDRAHEQKNLHSSGLSRGSCCIGDQQRT